MCVCIDPHLFTHVCGGQRETLGVVPQVSFVVVIVLAACFALTYVCAYMYVYICVCIYTFMWVTISMYTPWHTRGSQGGILGCWRLSSV